MWPVLFHREYSPHAWGWTAAGVCSLRLARVFPTRVGMDRDGRAGGVLRVCIPHTRGDGPLVFHLSENSCRYSPHAWGWTALHREMGRVEKVFPTRVGMDRYSQIGRNSRAGIPHTRGDGPGYARSGCNSLEYSPHAWGWTVRHPIKRTAIHVFPTRVGMDRNMKIRPRLNGRIPHTRGDGPR